MGLGRRGRRAGGWVLTQRGGRRLGRVQAMRRRIGAGADRRMKGWLSENATSSGIPLRKAGR